MRINSKSIITLLIAFLMIFGTAFNGFSYAKQDAKDGELPNTQVHLRVDGFPQLRTATIVCHINVKGEDGKFSEIMLPLTNSDGKDLFKSTDLNISIDNIVLYFDVNNIKYYIGNQIQRVGQEGKGTMNYKVVSLPKFNLTYDGGGTEVTGNPPIGVTQHEAGVNVIVLGNTGSYALANHAFDGWKDENGTKYVAGNSLLMPFADVTLYAQWKEIKFNVSYNSNGATAGNSDLPGTTPYYQGQSFIIFNPTTLERGEDIFMGWEFNGLIYTPDTPFAMGNSDVVFTAVWQAKPPVTDPETPKYNVTYHENLGGITTYEQTNILSGTSINLIGLPSGFNTTNKTFKGWSTSTVGPVDSPVGKNVTVTENLDFYAVWENDPTYKVNYYGNGNTSGSVPLDSKAYYKNDEASVLPIVDLAKTHSSFLGWSTNQAATSADYSDASKITITDHDVYLFAVWQPDKTYKVTYNANGGNGNVPEDFDNYYMESTATVLGKGDLDKPNHTFKGWKIGNEDKLYQAGNTLMIAGDVTLMAVWEFVPPQESNPPSTNPPQETNPPTTESTTVATTEATIEEVEIEEEVGAPAGAASSIVETTEELVELDDPIIPLSALPQTGQLPVELFYGVGGLITAAGVYLKRKAS